MQGSIAASFDNLELGYACASDLRLCGVACPTAPRTLQLSFKADVFQILGYELFVKEFQAYAPVEVGRFRLSRDATPRDTIPSLFVGVAMTVEHISSEVSVVRLQK